MWGGKTGSICHFALPFANLAVWFAVSVLIELSSNKPTQTNEHILGCVCRKSSFIAARVGHSEWDVRDFPYAFHLLLRNKRDFPYAFHLLLRNKTEIVGRKFPSSPESSCLFWLCSKSSDSHGVRWQPGRGKKLPAQYIDSGKGFCFVWRLALPKMRKNHSLIWLRSPRRVMWSSLRASTLQQGFNKCRSKFADDCVSARF